MNFQEFQTAIQELQDTAEIGKNWELRRKFYDLFDDLYLFLESKKWEKENLVEHHELNQNAHFQSIAEGYYRLGFFETSFYYFSKLVYDLWYQKTLDYQEENDERIHKGTQVHQIGIIFDLLSNKKSSWNYYLAGLIEDLVSDRTMESSQAFRMLRVLGMPREESVKIRSNVQKAGIIFDPLDYVSKLQQETSLSTYDENQSIDYNKLKQADILWKQLILQRKEEEEKNVK